MDTMTIHGIQNELLTDGEGRIFGKNDTQGYLISVNAHNAIKLSELMKSTGNLVAEFVEEGVLIRNPQTQQHDENTVFAVMW